MSILQVHRTLNTKSLKLYIKQILGHPLIASTFRIFSGNILIQIISFFTLPFFARIYLPGDYGVWGIFIFLSGLLAVIAGLRYELSVMIPSSDLEAGILVRVAKTNSLVMLLITLPLFGIFYSQISGVLNLKTGILLMLLVPLHAYLTGYNTLLSQWLSRKKMFRQLASIRIVQSLLNIILSFLFGYLMQLHYWGLVLSTFLSVLIADCVYMYLSGISFYSGFIRRKDFLIKYMMRYRNFLFYSTPLGLLNYFTANILSYLLQVNFGAAVLGLYTNATRLINTPLSLISASFSSVFYQHFSRSQNKVKVLCFSFAGLLLIFTSLLLPFILWGENLIVWYLGENWRASAEFIKVLSFLTIMSFTTSSISTIFSFMQKEDVVLLWQVIYLVVILVVFSIYKNDFTNAMWMYSFTGGVAYLLLFGIGYIKVKKLQAV